MKQFLAPLLAVASLSVLAGCGGGTASLLPCPQVAVLQQAQTLASFLPGRSDVAAQITTAQITGVAGSCTLEKQQHLLEVKFQAGFLASKGPASNGAPLTLPYFVAITEGDNVIAKTDYTIALAFDGNASTAQAVSKPIRIKLSSDRDSSDVQILVGFELTPDQLNEAESHPLASP